MQYLSSEYHLLPGNPGVYRFLNKNKEVIYVGKANNLKKRVSSYFYKKSLLGPKTQVMVSQIHWIQIVVVDSELESLLLEANLIKKYNPKYNSRLTDGKAYPLIRITKKSEFPAVVIARKQDDPKSIYFGAFPSMADVRLVMRLMRRIFPFHSVLNHPKKICLYNHLGLCPCVPAQPNGEHKTMYRKTVNHIIDFLQGKKKKVLRDLEKQRDTLSKSEDFETAQYVQKQINAITYVTTSFHKPLEYEVNPNLKSDLREKELKNLQSILRLNDVEVELPARIECFDMSNFAGKQSVGSMVVFIQGEKSTDNYRRFKIYRTTGPNDFANMEEVLQRRMKHVEWDYPELIIVDGGKGQISSAMKIMKEYQLTIPVMGLAKREETIITSDFKEISLPKDTPALHLVMRIRDEAHRFAITYHRKLRSIATFE